MKAATDSIAVIRTRMPYVDRRALSEAWFSALHLARDGRLAVPQRRTGDLTARPPASAVRPSPAARDGAPGAGTIARAASRRSGGRAALEPDGLVGREQAASVKGRPLARPVVPPPLNASFTMTIEGARVQMLVRRDGPTLRITAICAAAHLATVRHALASAELAMRLRGHTIHSSARAASETTS